MGNDLLGFLFPIFLFDVVETIPITNEAARMR